MQIFEISKKEKFENFVVIFVLIIAAIVFLFQYFYSPIPDESDSMRYIYYSVFAILLSIYSAYKYKKLFYKLKISKDSISIMYLNKIIISLTWNSISSIKFKSKKRKVELYGKQKIIFDYTIENFRLLLLYIAQYSDNIRNEIFKFYEKHYGYKLKTDLIKEEINFIKIQ